MLLEYRIVVAWTKCSDNEDKATESRQFGSNSLENGELPKAFKQTNSDMTKALLI